MDTPTPMLPFPGPLAARYGAWSRRPVWQNEAGGITWRLERKGAVHFAKVAPATTWPPLSREVARLRWAQAHLPVPDLLDAGEGPDVHWLVTGGLPGLDATRDPEPPGRRVQLLGAGLRRFHEAPVVGCPFRFGIDTALALVRDRVSAGQVVPDRDFHPVHAQLTAAAAVERLERTRPDTEDLVVCHGDYCLPNVVLQAGRITGYLDLGELGVADRWWDLAVATWSVTWNLGPGHEEAFLEAYGARPDPARTAWYRLLYDLAS